MNSENAIKKKRGAVENAVPRCCFGVKLDFGAHKCPRGTCMKAQSTESREKGSHPSTRGLYGSKVNRIARKREEVPPLVLVGLPSDNVLGAILPSRQRDLSCLCLASLSVIRIKNLMRSMKHLTANSYGSSLSVSHSFHITDFLIKFSWIPKSADCASSV